MGYIKEPEGVDFVVSPSDFTEEINNSITDAIAEYKRDGRKPLSNELKEDRMSYARTDDKNDNQRITRV